MNTDFATAMRRSLEQTRTLDVRGATATIQQALSGRGEGGGEDLPRRTLSLPGIGRSGAGAADDADRPEPRPRQRLGEVVRLLRETINLRGGGGTGPAKPLELPDGARFEARSFACHAGSRQYRLYVPASLEGAPAGVLVMLHGCTQDPEDFAAGTGMHAQAEADRLVVVWPEQTRGDNAAACWNWFRPGDQRRDAGEPAILAGIAREVASEFGVRPDRTFVAGLSAGGAMAHVLAVTYPDVFAAAGVHSGLAHGSASDVASAFATMRGQSHLVPGRAAAVPVIVFHGSADTTVHPSNAKHIAGAATVTSVHENRAAGGRRYTRTVAMGPEGSPLEVWLVEGAGHAWSGGHAQGSYTDPSGPDASAEMARFFLEQTVYS